MRVWILERTPDFDPSLRLGVFSSPLKAWDDLLTEVDDHVFGSALEEFTVRLLSEDRRTEPEKADIILDIVYRVNDRITLTGVFVEGSDNPSPTLAEWRDFQQLGALLMRCAVSVQEFAVTEVQENGKPVGIWKFARDID